MGTKQAVRVWAAVALATVVQAWTPAPASASESLPAALPACGDGGRVEVAISARRQAASRTGRIPGLGQVKASADWDGSHEMTLTGMGFEVTRRFSPVTRQAEIVISGADDVPLEIRFGSADGLSLTRGATVLRGTSNPDALRALVGGPAVAAFRELIGNYERGLMAGVRAGRADDAHADGFLLAGAFVSSLAGDPTAVGRARDLISGRIRGPFRAARFQFKDCVGDYEKYLLMIDQKRTDCLAAAEGRDSWYARAADRLGCEAEFMAGALAGEGQFVGCTALGAILL